MDADLEVKQGRSLVDAANNAHVEFSIWSSLLNIKKLTNGKLPNVYHFDAKAKIEEYSRAVGIPASYFLPGFYMSNLPGQSFKSSAPNDAWTLSLATPETAPIPMFDIADTGKVVKAMVLNRKQILGKRVLRAARYMTPKEIVEEFRALYPEDGKSANFVSVPHDIYLNTLKSFGLPDFAAKELLENMHLFDEGGYDGGASLEESHALLEDPLTTWIDFMKKSPAFKDLN
ncbi:nmrA-like family domain-containing protein 1 [Colletotrichum liriopes]|uniref:NmrA-like family domain-containing protein 1 n=1 Tax=Colletotrichum liriopes TaxID=708192 RepID=A0AA37LYX0_9PEZI|nr:nmrA-like family domain-containing protein 1 [Colletotrichum liriopes]